MGKIKAYVMLGNITHGPELLRQFGLSITQDGYYCVFIDGIYTLDAFATYDIKTFPNMENKSHLKNIEGSVFAFLSISVGQLAIMYSFFLRFS